MVLLHLGKVYENRTFKNLQVGGGERESLMSYGEIEKFMLKSVFLNLKEAKTCHLANHI